MGGLGNGRRGGRSPPLMIGALIACILLLGFNYWMSSSRNLELQTKLYQLEGQVRRGAAERGEAELKRNEFQEEIKRQKKQISHMESLFETQLKGTQNTCSQDKGTLQLNISSSAKTIQELKGQLNKLTDDLGKLQKELQGCHGNIKTLNDRLTDDMSHCHSQVLSQKELCDERMAAAKLEFQKKTEKLIPSPGVSSHENAEVGPVKEERAVITVANAVQTSPAVNQTPRLSQPNENEPLELLTNEIMVDKGSNALPVDPLSVKDLSKIEPQSVSSAAAIKQDVLPSPEDAVTTEKGGAITNKPLQNNLTEDRDMELMDTHEEDAKTEEAEARMEGTLTGQGKDVGIEKPEELEDYDAEEQVLGGVDFEKRQQSKQPENIDLEQELADYNGDDENEGEFEADKQAELAQI